MSYEGDAERVTVPSGSFTLDREDYEGLKRVVSPNASSPNFGMDLFSSTVDYIEQL